MVIWGELEGASKMMNRQVKVKHVAGLLKPNEKGSSKITVEVYFIVMFFWCDLEVGTGGKTRIATLNQPMRAFHWDFCEFFKGVLEVFRDIGNEDSPV